MAPVTRSSVYGRKSSQETDRPEYEQDLGDDMESDQEMASSSEVEEIVGEENHGDSLFDAGPPSSAQELLRPLQETADRVSRQMEQFAQALDQFHTNRSASQEDLWNNTFVLMENYSVIAKDRAEQLESERNGPKSSQRNRKSLGDTTAQKDNLKLESSLWDLSSNLLPYQNHKTIDDFQYSQNVALLELHRYSTNPEIWSAMLEVDPVADQYDTMLKWLQEWKQNNSPELTDNALESWTRTDRGDGTSPHTMGNLFTQGPIKSLKRKRVHPGPLDYQEASVRRIHQRESDGARLVTEMDPDAASRQNAVLEVQDELYEDSAWHMCWEMLRRGWPLDKSREWWQERNELFRYLISQAPASQANAQIDRSWFRIANLASNRLYAELCRELGSQHSSNNQYENAVYGVVGGSYAATTPICKTIDDHLFCLINELLVERFQQFLTAVDRKVADPKMVEYKPQPSKMQEISKYFRTAQTEKLTTDEAHQPLKYLQCSIMSGEVVSFLQEMGHAAAQMAHSTGESKTLFDHDDANVGECARTAARHEDAVRVIVHLQLALQALGLLEAVYKSDRITLENNIINYIGLLERHSKFLLLPLYASKLSSERQPRILGRILSKVTNPKERDTQLRLMKQYNIAVNKVIYTICDYARKMWTPTIVDNVPAQIVMYEKKIVCIRTGFIGEVTDERDKEVIEAHEWVNYIDTKNWGMAVWLVTTLYKALLLSGKIAAAKYLSTKVGLAATSLKATGMNLSIAASLYGTVTPDRDTSMMSDDEDDESNRLSSPTKKRKETREQKTHPLAKEATSRKELADQSQTWAHLEHLVFAMDILEEWQFLADSVDNSRSDLRRMKSAKSRLQTQLQSVHQAMQPLFEPEFLNTPNDEDEMEELTEIRNHYLPECVLAYNSALYFAGHSLSRQHLVSCIDIAQIVAQNPALTDAFVASKRMKELVITLALDSQALLRANESGGSNTRGHATKRSLAGSKVRSDIWQVSWRKNLNEGV